MRIFRVMAKSAAGFHPNFVITPSIASDLIRIEAGRHAVESLPITPRVLAALRKSARLVSTHYSTMIEGNLLTQEQVAKVISESKHFPGRERDEKEVLGYYAALDEVDRLASAKAGITERNVQTLHAFVMSGGKGRIKPTPYRDGQNVIRDSRTGGIVYMPPEAGAVPGLMEDMLAWINAIDDLPVPLRAAIAHYQFATIHPYYDGNGRTARLLTTLILHLGGYGLKGLYALEEYYARDLASYYTALTIGPSHNYHLGRAEADITQWVAYFIGGMATSFEKVQSQAAVEAAAGAEDRSKLIHSLDAKQRRVLALFRKSPEITSKDVAALFDFNPRTASNLCQQWLEQGFLRPSDTSRKNRTYRLSEEIAAAL